MKKLDDFDFEVSDKKAKEIEKSTMLSRELESVAKVRAWNIFAKRYNISTRLLTCAFLLLILFTTFLYKDWITDLINFNFNQPKYESGNFYVHFIDVGEGKAIAIRTAYGKNILIDCGEASVSHKLNCYLNQKFFVGENSEKVFDCFIITHLDADHAGGLNGIFKNFEIRNCYRPNVFTSEEMVKFNIKNPQYQDDSELNVMLADCVFEEKCGVIQNAEGLVIKMPSAKAEFFAPQFEYYSNSNAYSPIIKFTQTLNFENGLKNYTFLLTGDIPASYEELVVKKYGYKLKCDVLDVSHHGSKDSTCEKFCLASQPTYAVFSVSETNLYEFPDEEVYNRLIDAGVSKKNFLLTSDGSIVFSADENGILKYEVIENIDLNVSDYSYIEIFVVLFAVIIIFCFAFAFPEKPRVF